jgi:uncharacterized protein (DUF433 family)
MFEATGERIVKTPDVCFGRPRIAGTRMRVKDVVYFHRVGWSVETISDQFDITPGQIYAALSYYFDHQAEIDEDMQRDREFARSVEGKSDELRRRIEARMAEMRGDKS